VEALELHKYDDALHSFEWSLYNTRRGWSPPLLSSDAGEHLPSGMSGSFAAFLLAVFSSSPFVSASAVGAVDVAASWTSCCNLLLAHLARHVIC
jgi:hypothetical protein